MKAKGKAKQLFCMVCAFAASFLVTVTAFAAVDISNDDFYGVYKYPGSDNQRILNNDGEIIRLQIYRDDDYHGYYSGTSYNFKLSNSPGEQFLAKCERVTMVNPSNGAAYSPLVTIDDYTATGDVRPELNILGHVKSVTIRSKQSSHTYVNDK